MILPSGVKTRHKIRDTKIVQMYAEGYTLDEIGKKVGLCKQTCSYLVRKNKHVFDLDKNFEKVKRLNRIKRIYDKSETLVPKSVKEFVLLNQEYRRELEGDVVGGEVKQIVQVFMPGKDAIDEASQITDSRVASLENGK